MKTNTACYVGTWMALGIIRKNDLMLLELNRFKRKALIDVKRIE